MDAEAGLGEGRQQRVAALAVVGRQSGVVGVGEPERGDRGLLERRRGADRQEVVGSADADAQQSATRSPSRPASR